MHRIPMTINDWIKKLDGFLRLNDRDILIDSGKVSHVLAKSHAESEYDTFHRSRQEIGKYSFNLTSQQVQQ